MTAATVNVRMQVLRLAQDTDPALLTAEQCVGVVEDLAVAHKALTTVLVFSAVRVAKTELWRGKGYLTAAEWLAAQLGVSVREASGLLSTGKRADKHPKTKDAMKKGKVSASQADAITDAAEADPTVEDELLDTAAHDTTARLKEKAAAAKAAATDEDHQRRRAKRERSRWGRTNADGSFDFHLHGPAGDLARLEALLRPWDEQVFRLARPHPDGTRDSFSNRSYDAFMAFALHQAGLATDQGPGTDGPDRAGGTVDLERSADAAPGAGAGSGRLPGGSNVKVIIRIDWEALVRGHTVAGETCDIPGLGPMPVSAVRELMDDAFLAAIVTKGRDVHAVAHLGRGLNAHQRTAIDWTGTICSNIACNRTIAVQMDHNLPWNQDPRTKLDNIDPLCPHHHQLKTHHGWHLEPGTGRRRFLPPDHTDAGGSGVDPPDHDAWDPPHHVPVDWEQPTLC